MKTISVFAMLAVLLLSSVSAVETEGPRVDVPEGAGDEPDLQNTGSVLPLDVVYIKINGDEVTNDRTVREVFDRGDELDVRVKLEATADVEDVSVLARVFGDEHYDVLEVSDNFDMQAGDRQTVDLTLRLPEIADEGSYKLRVIVADRDGAAKVYNYNLRVDAQRHFVMIDDVYFSPNARVEAGRALLSVVRLENLGEGSEDGVRVTVSLPALGVSATDYVDEMDADDEVSTEELYLRIPADAASGVYDVLVDVEYDEGFATESAVYQIEVVGAPEPADEPADEPARPGRTVVSVGLETQDVVAGAGGAIYPVTLSNEGSEAKTYTLGTSGADSFATVEVSPSSLVMLKPGETKTVYVYVSANEDATTGAHSFSVDIKNGAETLQQVPLTANVVAPQGGDWDGVKKGLEVGLIVLIIVLIVLGLIVAFSKAKKGDDDGDEELAGQTYY